MIYDSLDNHLSAAGGIDRAAVPLGFYVAWLANLKLLSEAFEDANQTLVMRVRYRDVKGSELLTAGCGGELAGDMLSPAGQAFSERYLPDRYLADFRSVFGDDVYAVSDSWQQYDRIAPLITRVYMRGGQADKEKRWWQIWR